MTILLKNGWATMRCRRACLLLLPLVWHGNVVLAQVTLYTHASDLQGDGFLWDADPHSQEARDLPHNTTFATPDLGVHYGNFTGNALFFDALYDGLSNAGRIDGAAWHGTPTDLQAEVELGFADLNLGAGGARYVRFGLAWAVRGRDAPRAATVRAIDYEAGAQGEDYEAEMTIPLDETFAAGGNFNGFLGAGGEFAWSAQDVVDGLTGAPFGAIDDLWIDLSAIASPAGEGEFAIDNVFVIANGAAAPADFNRDGGIDGADLSQWRTCFAQRPASAGDADGDRDCDGADFLAWQRGWSPIAAISVNRAAVPEPVTLSVIALAGGPICACVRCRTSHSRPIAKSRFSSPQQRHSGAEFKADCAHARQRALTL